MRSIRSQAKVFGTLATVAGAMMMTVIEGPVLELFWIRGGGTTTNNIQNGSATGGISLRNSIKGSLLITVGCFNRAFFMILQGIVHLGFTYYIQGAVMKHRGPVFVTAFSPLSMVLVAVLSTSILAEQPFLGRLIGAVVIVAGLYYGGKSKDLHQ